MGFVVPLYVRDNYGNRYIFNINRGPSRHFNVPNVVKIMKKKPSKEKVRDLIGSLAYQQQAGIHTMGYCNIEGCDFTARGSLRCKKHAKEELATIIGCPTATKLSKFFHHRMMIQINIDDLINEILSNYE